MTERYWIAIPAAGRGERFSGSMPKQYCSVAGATLLDRCLSVFLEWEFCLTVVVAVSADDHQFHQSRFAQHPQVVVVTTMLLISTESTPSKAACTVSEQLFWSTKITV